MYNVCIYTPSWPNRDSACSVSNLGSRHINPVYMRNVTGNGFEPHHKLNCQSGRDKHGVLRAAVAYAPDAQVCMYVYK